MEKEALSVKMEVLFSGERGPDIGLMKTAAATVVSLKPSDIIRWNPVDFL